MPKAENVTIVVKILQVMKKVRLFLNNEGQC